MAAEIVKAARKRRTKENRFKKILDDAERALKDLEDIGDYRFLDNLPKATDKAADDDKPYMPFPYGPQPDSKTGWR